jgi:hypothetical protein
MENNDLLNNLNIFNRCIFKKATKNEIKSSLKYFTNIEDYEKCIILKELLDIKYFIDDPIKNDIEQLNNLIKKQENLLEILSDISSDKTINKDVLNDIENYTDEIIINILKNDKLKNEYLNVIYDDVSNIKNPDINKKYIPLLNKYKQESINNLKKML